MVWLTKEGVLAPQGADQSQLMEGAVFLCNFLSRLAILTKWGSLDIKRA